MIKLISKRPGGKRGSLLLRSLLKETEPLSDRKVYVSWGVVNYDYSDADVVLNAMPKISNFQQLSLFNIKRVPHPEYTLGSQTIDDPVNWFGRDENHQKGLDIVDHTHPDFIYKDYWIRKVSIKEEWRIHVFLDRSIARGLKVKTREPLARLKQSQRGLPIRNRRFGWTMRHDVEPPKGMRDIAKRAVAAVGYDFGGVDLYVDVDGNIGVFEVNKTPGQSNYTGRQYVKAFQRVEDGTWQK